MISESQFGIHLKELRNEAGLTIRQLEEKSGVSNAYLSQLENGKRSLPSPEILKKIHEPLNVSYEELMEKAGYVALRNDVSEDDLKLLSEMKKYPNLYNALIEQPEYLVEKIYKVFKAFYN